MHFANSAKPSKKKKKHAVPVSSVINLPYDRLKNNFNKQHTPEDGL